MLYQAPKTLYAAIATSQMVESCCLTAGATARGVRSTHVNVMDVPGLVAVDETPLTLSMVVKAFHIALALQPLTPAGPATSVPKGPSRDPGGDHKQVKTLQEGLRKQAVDNDRRFSQVANQIAHLAGSIERIESLLRPASTALGLGGDPLEQGNSQAAPIDLKVGACNRSDQLGNFSWECLVRSAAPRSSYRSVGQWVCYGCGQPGHFFRERPNGQ